MRLAELKIHHLRNILSAHLILSERFNFILGPNGSGKTSILEALYLLSCGHSFRTREIAPIVTHKEAALTVFGRATNEDVISIQKSANKPTQIKINGHVCNSTSQLAYTLPCQVFYSDIFQIIDAGSSVRRSVLEWGLFHVKHEYLTVWKEYRKVLKQRNALLKSQAPYEHFIPWDKQLSQLAYTLHNYRSDYFNQWEDAYVTVLSQLTDSPCSIYYFKGWDKKNTGVLLEDILRESFLSDKQKTYTQHGAHQADILFESKDVKSKHVLSRGQQKIILIALKLAQASLLNQECLFLFDDLAAELDETHQMKLFNYLIQHKGQYVITSTAMPHFDVKVINESCVFTTLSHGEIVSRETTK